MEANISLEDLSPDASLRRLTGETGVFVGGEDDLAAAKNRWEAMKAYETGQATPEQVALLRDLDKVMQGANTAPAPQQPAAPAVQPQAQRPGTSGRAFLEAVRRNYG